LILYRQAQLRKNITLTKQEELEVAIIVTSAYFGIRLFLDILLYMVLAVLLILASDMFSMSPYIIVGTMTVWSIVFAAYSYFIGEDYREQ
jgi:ABC-type multidrug transport system permease subunit